MAISKKMMNTHAFQQTIHLFMCPICSLSMDIVDGARFVCDENHSFDLSRQGYVNLAPQAHATKYDQSLFEARKKVMTNGFFDPLMEKLVAFIEEQITDRQHAKILDAGSGEGSHLAHLLSQLQDETLSGVGIDLSKEGIAAAAKNYPGNSWVVADLANCPFEADAFDVIVNILSPANYKEFTRLLKEDGLLIKVVPEQDYLRQLREVLYEETEKEQEGDPVARVAAHFEAVQTTRIRYDFPLNNDLLASLIRMTPLAWGASEEKVNEAISSNLPFVTVDFTVMVATNRVLNG